MRVPRVRFTVRRLMAAVAVLGVLLGAWVYRRENASIERSFTAIQLRSLDGGDALQRRMAVENLDHSGPEDLARVLPALAAGMGDGDWRVRLAAARVLGVLGRGLARDVAAAGEIELALRDLIRAGDDSRAEVRLKAMRSLGAFYTDEKAPPRNPRRRAARATVEETERRAVELLLHRLSDADPATRSTAAGAFSRVGSATGAGPDPLVAILLSDPDREVRIAAARALPVGWPTLSELYPPLLHRLEQARSVEERSAIGWAIGGLPAPPVELVPNLIEALELDDFALNKTVPTALAKLGPVARPALPALARAAAREIADPMAFSALEASQAIVAIDGDSPEAQSLLAPIVALLRGSRGELMQHAAVVLAKYGPSAAPAVPALRRALGSDVADVRERAAFVLGTIGPAARPALSELMDLARRDPDPRLGRTAAEAMRRIDAE